LFVKRLKYHYKSDLKYLVVWEHQPISKRVHYHVIVFNGHYVKSTWLNEIWGNGFIKLKRINNPDASRIANYFMKYLSKETLAMRGKTYFTSKNLNLPYKERLCQTEDIEAFFKEKDNPTANEIVKRNNRFITVLEIST